MKEIKLVFGVGINDMRGVPGWRKKDCPFYGTWYSMVQRCHSRNFQKKHPTYKGVTICEEWLTFSQFIAWAKTQDYKDKCLDKDILIPGNKHYSPDACMFVDPLINKQGVRIDPEKPKSGKKYPPILISEIQCLSGMWRRSRDTASRNISQHSQLPRQHRLLIAKRSLNT